MKLHKSALRLRQALIGNVKCYECWPTKAELSRATGMVPSVVAQRVEELRVLGLVEALPLGDGRNSRGVPVRLSRRRVLYRGQIWDRVL